MVPMTLEVWRWKATHTITTPSVIDNVPSQCTPVIDNVPPVIDNGKTTQVPHTITIIRDCCSKKGPNASILKDNIT